MITDVLFKRYPASWIGSDRVPEKLSVLLRQAAIIFLDDVAPKIPNHVRLFDLPERQLARELGAMLLGSGRSAEERIVSFLGEQYDLWNDSHGLPDSFFKLRLSLLELLFREAEAIVGEFSLKKDVPRGRFKFSKQPDEQRGLVEDAATAIELGVKELNDRFRSASLPLQYHNGIIQLIDDPLTTQEIETPFWSLVSCTELRNVDLDIKEALDRRDSGKSDAAFHALRALESTLKVISKRLGRTRGTEKGAAEFIDNLVSAKLGRFVEPWEAEMLKSLFREIRNPLGHGAGTETPLVLTGQQSSWVIESCMSWIKNLWRRLP